MSEFNRNWKNLREIEGDRYKLKGIDRNWKNVREIERIW